MNTAQLLKDNLSGYKGRAALYRVNPPIRGWEDDESYSLVVLSTSEAFGHLETLVFPADENGQVTYWGELPSSRRNVASHQQILENAGYTVVKD